MKTKAVIYCRFSPRRRAAECDSIEVQMAQCEKYCEFRGYEVVGRHTDSALSGKSMSRPGLKAAIRSLKRGEVLVAVGSSRLARNVHLSEIIYEKVAKRRASVELVEDGGRVATDPMSVCMRQVRAAFDELDRKMIGKRTKAAMLHAQANGRAMSKRPPYGWERVGSELRQVESEQVILRRIVAMRLSGLGFRPIARALGADGLTCRGNVWRHSTIKSICRRASESSAVQS